MANPKKGSHQRSSHPPEGLSPGQQYASHLSALDKLHGKGRSVWSGETLTLSKVSARELGRRVEQRSDAIDNKPASPADLSYATGGTPASAVPKGSKDDDPDEESQRAHSSLKVAIADHKVETIKWVAGIVVAGFLTMVALLYGLNQSFRAEVQTSFNQFRTEMDRRLSGVEAKTETQQSRVDSLIDSLRGRRQKRN